MKQKRWKTDGYLRIFASYYRPHWKLFVLDMVCALCICLVDLAFPIVSRFSMQTLLPGQMFTAFFVSLLCCVVASCRGVWLWVAPSCS